MDLLYVQKHRHDTPVTLEKSGLSAEGGQRRRMRVRDWVSTRRHAHKEDDGCVGVGLGNFPEDEMFLTLGRRHDDDGDPGSGK